ncbi:MAG: hypothetical protein G01um101448_1120 [Parcubacteria group bacterium Gr01-1014_48]|nr:MAG: hypothetical protein G01um101448_1120 [Parcubacteria group bacterium Gr01-1014_48]
MVFVCGLFLSAAFVAGLFWEKRDGESAPKQRAEPAEFTFAVEVEQVIQRKLSLMEELLRDGVIVQAVTKANKAREYSLEEILQLDDKWRASEGVNEFIRPFLMNDVARRLMEFQEDYPGFSEIFVTDLNGLNVGQTNKTTDYYQADEDWWIGAFDGGEGKSFHGPIEFDESSQVEAISLYAPVRDPMSNKIIGVAKAVVSVAAIKLEL